MSERIPEYFNRGVLALSFSSETKGELCRIPLSRRCCAQAEAYGILLFCNQFSSREIRIVTESEDLSQRLPILFKKAFHETFDRLPTPGAPGKRIFSITSPEKIAGVSGAFGYDPAESLAHHINFAVLEEEHCRASFFRGAFLAGGSVTDPGKRYHLELTTSHYSVSRELASLLLDAGFSPKEITRKANYVTYFKQSEAVEDFLTAIGAPISAMEIMTAKAEKNLVESVNRKVNCDAANLDKAVEAAQDQIEAIRKLEADGTFDSLADKLRETAALRKEYPELTLSQLAEICVPPVTKSCLNHRMRKLMELARG